MLPASAVLPAVLRARLPALFLPPPELGPLSESESLSQFPYFLYFLLDFSFLFLLFFEFSLQRENRNCLHRQTGWARQNPAGIPGGSLHTSEAPSAPSSPGRYERSLTTSGPQPRALRRLLPPRPHPGWGGSRAVARGRGRGLGSARAEPGGHLSTSGAAAEGRGACRTPRGPGDLPAAAGAAAPRGVGGAFGRAGPAYKRHRRRPETDPAEASRRREAVSQRPEQGGPVLLGCSPSPLYSAQARPQARPQAVWFHHRSLSFLPTGNDVIGDPQRRCFRRK